MAKQRRTAAQKRATKKLIAFNKRGGKKAKENYQIGEELELKVIRVDAEHRRIALSERALQPQVEEEAQGPERERRESPERPRERYREEELTDRFTLEEHLREFEEEQQEE